MIKPHPIYSNYRQEDVDRILSQYGCDIDIEFPGFVEQYEALAKVIPTHFIVIDFGCAFATQCCLFKNHKKYIGIDWGEIERFKTDNTEHHISDIETWIEKHAKELPPYTFAICNYVGGRPADICPSWESWNSCSVSPQEGLFYLEV